MPFIVALAITLFAIPAFAQCDDATEIDSLFLLQDEVVPLMRASGIYVESFPQATYAADPVIVSSWGVESVPGFPGDSSECYVEIDVSAYVPAHVDWSRVFRASIEVKGFYERTDEGQCVLRGDNTPPIESYALEEFGKIAVRIPKLPTVWDAGDITLIVGWCEPLAIGATRDTFSNLKARF